MKSTTQKPQSRAKVPKKKARRPGARAPQSRPRGPKPGTAAAAEAFNIYNPHWHKCWKLLQKGTEAYQDELLQVNACASLPEGMTAEVNWYRGGSACVEMARSTPCAPGVYLAKTRWFGGLRGAEELPRTVRTGRERGPDVPVARIKSMRRLGTTAEVMHMAQACRKELGWMKHSRILEMCTTSGSTHCEHPSDDDNTAVAAPAIG